MRSQPTAFSLSSQLTSRASILAMPAWLLQSLRLISQFQMCLHPRRQRSQRTLRWPRAHKLSQPPPPNGLIDDSDQGTIFWEADPEARIPNNSKAMPILAAVEADDDAADREPAVANSSTSRKGPAAEAPGNDMQKSASKRFPC